jgi:hypothetical protein
LHKMCSMQSHFVKILEKDKLFSKRLLVQQVRKLMTKKMEAKC